MALGLALAAAVAGAAPVPGFVEDWPLTSTDGWGGGAMTSNPGSGGIGGAADGFLLVSTTIAPGFLGSVSFGAEYAGDWTAAGVTAVRFSLNDVNGDEALEIHFGIGNGFGFWLSKQGFIPPEHAWAQFTVPLVSSDFTEIIGTDPFATSLASTDRILLRHDVPPLIQGPDPIAADFGLDHLELLSGPLGVAGPPSAGLRPIEMAPPSPNPSRGPVAVNLRTRDGGPVRLEIVDAAGRLVLRARLDGAAAGPRTWMWDGRDGEGRTVAPGAYRVRAIGASGGVSRPLVRIR